MIKKILLLTVFLTVSLLADNYQILIRAYHFNSPTKNSVKYPTKIYNDVYGIFTTYNNIKIGYYKNSEHNNSFLLGAEGRLHLNSTAVGLGLSIVTGYDKLVRLAPNMFVEKNNLRVDFLPTIVRNKLRLAMSLSIIF